MFVGKLIARGAAATLGITLVLALSLPSDTNSESTSVAQSSISTSDQFREVSTVYLGSGKIQTVAWWNTIGDYATCVAGIGVPIAAAWQLALYYPMTWAGVTTWAYRDTSSGGRSSTRYLNRIFSACGRFIRS